MSSVLNSLTMKLSRKTFVSAEILRLSEPHQNRTSYELLRFGNLLTKERAKLNQGPSDVIGIEFSHDEALANQIKNHAMSSVLNSLTKKLSQK